MTDLSIAEWLFVSLIGFAFWNLAVLIAFLTFEFRRARREEQARREQRQHGGRLRPLPPPDDWSGGAA